MRVNDRLRTLLVLCACLALSLVAAACGDDGGSEGGTPVDESTDAETVLDRTFSAERQIESAVIDLVFDFDVDDGTQTSTFQTTVEGPIDASGDGFPVFSLTAEVKAESPDRNIDASAGATSTGDAAFLSYEGKNYEVDQATFAFLQGAFSQSEELQNEQGETPDGLPDTRDFLTDVRNEGTEEVSGVETVHVSGAVDVDALIKRIRPLAAQASALGGVGPTANIPTPAELEQLAKLVQAASFDVYSGADDNLLRRFSATIDLDQPQGGGTAQLSLDISLAEVNEEQEVEAPEDARPLSELLDEVGLGGLGLDAGGLEGLGGLGGLDGIGGAGGGSAGAGGGGETAPETPDAEIPPVPSPGEAEDYIECIEQVVTAEDLARCQELIQ